MTIEEIRNEAFVSGRSFTNPLGLRGSFELLAELCNQAIELRNALEVKLANPEHAISRLPPPDTSKYPTIARDVAGILIKQIEDENFQCALWMVSAISRLADSQPEMTVVELEGFIRQALPKVCAAHSDYKKNT